MKKQSTAAQWFYSQSFNGRIEPSQRYMTVLGGYKLDMENQGQLVRESLPEFVGKDYGADPLEDGTFRMIPSGDIVSFEERNRRLTRA